MKIPIDITSSTVEKIVERTVPPFVQFLSNLLGPASEEAGYVLRDHISRFRLNNVETVVEDTQDKCIKNNISTKPIAPKILCPMLDYIGLEDDEYLQDKWANLLSNMVDSEQNIQNHVFPYLLSQISKEEYLMLEAVIEDHSKEILNATEQLKKETKEFLKWKIERNIARIKGKTNVLHEHRQLVENYSIDNLIRLGIIKSNPIYTSTLTHDTGEYTNDIDTELIDEDIYLTDLGINLLEVCSEKPPTQRAKAINK